MYNCKKCESNEYVKAGFVKGEQRYKCKKRGLPLRQHATKGGARKKNFWPSGCTHVVIRSEALQSFFSQRSFGVRLSENICKK